MVSWFVLWSTTHHGNGFIGWMALPGRVLVSGHHGMQGVQAVRQAVQHSTFTHVRACATCMLDSQCVHCISMFAPDSRAALLSATRDGSHHMRHKAQQTCAPGTGACVLVVSLPCPCTCQ